MTIFEIIPFILFLVVIGTAIAERINLPYPIILVITGLLVSFTPGIPNWHPPSQMVLVLFLPPILFAAARLISWEEVQNNKGGIVSLAILLVIVTTVAVAYFLHWVIHLPLPAALVLGAIIAPTDATAATSILRQLRMRRPLIHSLEIESLFNDATSIILYKICIAFVIMGSINFPRAGTSIIIAGVGGILVGLLFAYFTGLIIKEFLTESENELPIIMSVILAYVSYVFADRLGLSGVLSVVAAGLFHKRTERAIKARTRLSEKAVWDSLIFFLNGLIFIVIGLQFQTYLNQIIYWSTSQLILLSLTTVVTLIVIRFLWISLSLYSYYSFYRFTMRTPTTIISPWRDILISSWSGMRGLVSLALAMAIPRMLPNGLPFPYRDLIIFLTMVTILFTLLVQGLTLPLLVKLLKVEDTEAMLAKEAVQIYRALTKKAIRHINQLEASEHICSNNARKLVWNYYANRLLQFKITYESECDTHEVGHEAELLLSRILNYERGVLHHMRSEKKISEEIYGRILTKIDRDEVGFGSYR